MLCFLILELFDFYIIFLNIEQFKKLICIMVIYTINNLKNHFYKYINFVLKLSIYRSYLFVKKIKVLIIT